MLSTKPTSISAFHIQDQPTETRPLLIGDRIEIPAPKDLCLLADYLSSSCNQETCIDTHHKIKNVLRGCSALIALSSTIPYVPIALRLGDTLGPISIVGNTSASSSFQFWATNAAISSILPEQKKAEKALFQTNQQRGTCQKVVLIIPAILAALTAKLPSTLAGVKYNEEQYKIPAAILLITTGSLVPMRSMQLSIEHLYKKFRKVSDADIEKIQQKMSSLLMKNRALFTEMKREDKLRLMALCDQVREQDPSVDKTNRYLSALLQTPEVPQGKHETIRRVINYAGLGLGAVVAGVCEFALGQYTFEVSKEEIWDNDVAAVAFTSLTVLTTSYLYGRSTIRTSQRVFNTIGNLINGNEIRNLGWQLRPKLSFALTSIGLLLDLCALGPTYVIWGDFYSANAFEHQFFQKTMCLSLFLIYFTATLDIIDDIVSHSIARGSEEEQKILALHKEFQKLAVTLEKSPAKELIRYLNQNESDTQKELLERISVTAEQLQSYSDKRLDDSAGCVEKIS